MAQDNTGRFSNRVADYVRYRPSYPPAIIPYLQEQYGLSTMFPVADVGAGTGISSSLFLDAGYRVIAVEPNQPMREGALQLLGNDPAFSAVAGSAEHTELPDASVGAIVAGQAFHWFDREQAATEFRRILQPGGLVVLIWNERATGSAFELAYDELIRKHAKDYVKVQHRNINPEHIRAFFSPAAVELAVFANSQVFGYEGLEGRLLSSSYMPARDTPGYEPMAADLKRLFEQYQEQDTITIHYDTKVYTGRLR